MPLRKPEEWKTNQAVTPEMMNWLLLEPRPDSLEKLRQERRWLEVFYVFLDSELAAENMEFLEAVDELRTRQPDAVRARAIYDQFVESNAPKVVNVDSPTRTEADTAFRDGAPDRADVFQACYDEIVKLLQDDKWRPFARVVDDLKKEANPYQGVSAPSGEVFDEVEAMKPPKLIPKEADTWNRAALKDMEEDDSTDLYELGGNPYVVILEAHLTKLPTPNYLTWARKYATATGTLKMTQKGDIFGKNPGSVKVVGANDKAGVKEAIGRISKKRVD
jgi:hypothetical protein